MLQCMQVSLKSYNEFETPCRSMNNSTVQYIEAFFSVSKITTPLADFWQLQI